MGGKAKQVHLGYQVLLLQSIFQGLAIAFQMGQAHGTGNGHRQDLVGLVQLLDHHVLDFIREIADGLHFGFNVIKDGLAVGEPVVVTDLVPAIEGMLLEPQEDKTLLTQLTAKASGEERLQ